MTISKSQHQAFLKLNQEPLNQQAKRLLELAGEEPFTDGCLHLLQLAEWRLARHQPDGGDSDYRARLLEKLQSLMDWQKPDNAYRYLLDNLNDPEYPLLEENALDDVQEPADGADKVLDAFEAAASADPGAHWPPPVSPLP